MEPRPRAEGADAPGEVLDVHEGRDGRWAWTYRDTATAFELTSYRTFGSKEEAAESARLAYPDLPFAEGPSEDAGSGS